MVYYTPATSHRAARTAPRVQLCTASWRRGGHGGVRLQTHGHAAWGRVGDTHRPGRRARHEGACAVHTGSRTHGHAAPPPRSLAPPRLPAPPCLPHSSLRGGGLQPPPPAGWGRGLSQRAGWLWAGWEAVPFVLEGTTVHCRSLSPSSLHMWGQRAPARVLPLHRHRPSAGLGGWRSCAPGTGVAQAACIPPRGVLCGCQAPHLEGPPRGCSPGWLLESSSWGCRSSRVPRAGLLPGRQGTDLGVTMRRRRALSQPHGEVAPLPPAAPGPAPSSILLKLLVKGKSMSQAPHSGGIESSQRTLDPSVAAGTVFLSSGLCVGEGQHPPETGKGMAGVWAQRPSTALRQACEPSRAAEQAGGCSKQVFPPWLLFMSQGQGLPRAAGQGARQAAHHGPRAQASGLPCRPAVQRPCVPCPVGPWTSSLSSGAASKVADIVFVGRRG